MKYKINWTEIGNSMIGMIIYDNYSDKIITRRSTMNTEVTFYIQNKNAS